jgi:DNA helicase HerA-like ATPase
MAALFLGHAPGGDARVELKPSRLTTHGVVVGMTGSGKTGLSLVLLEELVAQGVPVVAIDPKGDLGNLGLVFPDFAPEDFAPWCGRDDPAEVAARWASGVERAGLGREDVARLRDRMDLTVFTPGSTAGVPVDVLASLAAPPPEILSDDEALRDLVSDAISALLGLVGRAASPMKDPEHVLLSHVLESAWRAGESLDLAELIVRLVDPPFAKIGVFPVDRFFDPDARMDLAVAFNGVLASPSFAVWSRGEPLDPERYFRPAAPTSGSTPVSIFSLAHLDDSERQFFVSMLLSRILAWSRRQPGTEDLRALVFFDEVAGYLPPHPKQPPSKRPLLTMMKQTRAVGVGVVLSTQNPVDMDYKALSNAGVWAIGRLNTEQDRDRLLKGIDAPGLDGTVAGLEKRQFVLHQVGRGEPEVVGSRHAMCYLRGPLTRVEVGQLNALFGPVADVDDGPAAPAAPAASPVDDDLLPAPPEVEGHPSWWLDPRVAFSARMEGAFEGPAGPPRADGAVAFAPALYADLALRFDEDRLGFARETRIRRVWYPLGATPPEQGRVVPLEATDLLDAPPEGSRFALLPEWADEPKELAKLLRRAVDEVYRTESTGMFVNSALKLYGRADESREAFAARCAAAAEEAADAKIEALKEKYEARADRLDDRVAAKAERLAELEGVAKARQLEEAVNVGATVLGYLGFGRKRQVTSALTRRRQSARAARRVDQVEGEIERLEEDAAELLSELEAKVEAHSSRGRGPKRSRSSRARCGSRSRTFSRSRSGSCGCRPRVGSEPSSARIRSRSCACEGLR